MMFEQRRFKNVELKMNRAIETVADTWPNIGGGGGKPIVFKR